MLKTENKDEAPLRKLRKEKAFLIPRLNDKSIST